jgi:phosphocarrier protein
MERVVEVVPEAGLHARPASEVVRTSNEFDAEVRVGRVDDDDDLVRGDSMLSVTGLNVAHGESVRLVADGSDAASALDALEALLTTPVEGGGTAEDDGDADDGTAADDGDADDGTADGEGGDGTGERAGRER